MYSSTRDPPEHKEVPICTLKNFPYATDHVLRWAVDAFEMLFKQRPIDVNAYLSSRDFQESIRKSAPLSRLPILETLRDALLRHRPLRSWLSLKSLLMLFFPFYSAVDITMYAAGSTGSSTNLPLLGWWLWILELAQLCSFSSPLSFCQSSSIRTWSLCASKMSFCWVSCHEACGGNYGRLIWVNLGTGSVLRPVCSGHACNLKTCFATA
jgi:hypothetical protein